MFGDFDLASLLPYIAVGFAAQLVDGALGMAFGVIFNSLMVGVLGVTPALASQRVHVVECFTPAVSGLSHLFNGNIDKSLFPRLLLPGVAGAILGAYFLTSIDAAIIKPLVLTYVTGIGIYLLWRGVMYPPTHQRPRCVLPLGLLGGFLDAAEGGGWRSVVTSNLLVQGAEPRKVVGTVSAVEFFLTVTISAAFIFRLGFADLAGATLGFLIGGVAAAPIGAFAAKRFSTKWILVLVGVVLIITSAYGIWSALA